MLAAIPHCRSSGLELELGEEEEATGNEHDTECDHDQDVVAQETVVIAKHDGQGFIHGDSASVGQGKGFCHVPQLREHDALQGVGKGIQVVVPGVVLGHPLREWTWVRSEHASGDKSGQQQSSREGECQWVCV